VVGLRKARETANRMHTALATGQADQTLSADVVALDPLVQELGRSLESLAQALRFSSL
jgi:hypothetical protein